MKYELRNNEKKQIELVNIETGVVIDYDADMDQYPYDNTGEALLGGKIKISAAQFVAYSKDFTFFEKASFLSHLPELEAAIYLEIAHKHSNDNV